MIIFFLLQVRVAYLEKIKIDLFSFSIFFFMNTHEQILNINNNSQQSVQLLLGCAVKVGDMSS